ncbi:hypothetical protein GJ496_004955 [Pomphorhynchus laevis]|nr:hypothetical protein GJ496_004955 [Pomphorhynchus laevis]
MIVLITLIFNSCYSLNCLVTCRTRDYIRSVSVYQGKLQKGSAISCFFDDEVLDFQNFLALLENTPPRKDDFRIFSLVKISSQKQSVQKLISFPINLVQEPCIMSHLHLFNISLHKSDKVLTFSCTNLYKMTIECIDSSYIPFLIKIFNPLNMLSNVEIKECFGVLTIPIQMYLIDQTVYIRRMRFVENKYLVESVNGPAKKIELYSYSLTRFAILMTIAMIDNGGDRITFVEENIDCGKSLRNIKGFCWFRDFIYAAIQKSILDNNVDSTTSVKKVMDSVRFYCYDSNKTKKYIDIMQLNYDHCRQCQLDKFSKQFKQSASYKLYLQIIMYTIVTFSCIFSLLACISSLNETYSAFMTSSDSDFMVY